MKLEDVKHIAIIGSGNMGSGIAELLSRVGGYTVTMCDTSEDLVKRAKDIQRNNLQKRFVDKERMTAEEMEAVLGRISTTTKIAEAAGKADFIIEAVFEDMNVKKPLFKQVDEAAPPQTIVVTNTSYLSVTELASQTKRPEKVAGMHFFNPPGVMKLVEVVRAALTAEDTTKVVFDLAVKLEKEPVYCRDTYGFLANRAAVSSAFLNNDAIELVWAHIAPPEDIDKAVKLGYNRPMGPLELGDLIGSWEHAVNLENENIREFGWGIGHVHPMIKMMVRAGYTGGIGKKGIYDFWNDVLSKW